MFGIFVLFFGAAPFIFSFHFTADDYEIMYGAFLNPFSFVSDFRVFYYRPLATFSFALNSWISGWQPWSYHLLNVLLHAVNAVLTARLFMRVVPDGKKLAVTAGLLFFLLPQSLLNVYWIVGRTDVLCFTGVLSGVLFALRYSRDGRTLPLLLSLLGFVDGLLSKEAGLLFLMYVAVLYVLLTLSEAPKAERRRLLMLGLLALVVSALYFLLRYSVFGYVISDPSQQLPMDARRAVMWLLHGIGALLSPLDPVDLMAVYHTYPFAAVLLLLPIPGLLAMLVVAVFKGSRSERRRTLVAGAAALLSLGVYGRAFPSGRLAYLIVPLVLVSVLPVLSAAWGRSRTLRIATVLYLLVMLVSNLSGVWKFSMLSEWSRSAEAAVAEHDFRNDSLLVIGEIGRVGQTFSQLYMPLRYPPQLHALGWADRQSAFSIAGRFEGSVLTDWDRPFTIELRQDTLLLESTDNTSGFVPFISQKFSSLDPICQDGRTLEPIAFAPGRGGVLRSLRIYPVRGERSWVVVYDRGQLVRMRFGEFRARYGEGRAKS